MTRPVLIGAACAGLLLSAAGDALACGDKFLVSGRGTRYHRPKTARAASIVVFGPVELSGKSTLESVLKREGHRAAAATTTEQLAALLAGGRFDVVLVAAGVVDAVTRLVTAAPDAPAVVALAGTVKEAALLRSVDKAVAQRDKRARRSPLQG